MPSSVITIDGPAASGKSTTAKAVAVRLGLAHLDSGSLYRCITLAALEQRSPIEGATLARLAEEKKIELHWTGEHYTPMLAGRDVSEEIRGAAVTRSVSDVAALPEVREWVNAAVRASAAQHPKGVVVDGRDIGTVVFPGAALKVFLVADSRERARRRVLQEGLATDEENLSRTSVELDSRDRADSSRIHSPLMPHPDAVQIDTTNLTFDEQVDRVVDLARESLQKKGS